MSAVEAVYGDAAGPVIDALLDDEVAAWMGTAASQGSRCRFARRAGSFATSTRWRRSCGTSASSSRSSSRWAGARRRRTAGRARARRGGRLPRVRWAPATRSGARDGVDGAKLGRDVASLAAHDRLLLVADGDAERLFRAKYASRTLVEAAPAGLDEARSVFSRRRANYPGRRGPPVVCVDTSHSMAGGREAVAKAVALAACRGRRRRSAPVWSSHLVPRTSWLRSGVRASERRRRTSIGCWTSWSGASAAAPTSSVRSAGPSRRSSAARRASFVNRHAIADADILLVSDGELLDPPADEKTLRRSTGSARRAGPRPRPARGPVAPRRPGDGRVPQRGAGFAHGRAVRRH